MCKLSFRPEAEFGHQMIRPLHTLVISVCGSALLCAALQKTEKWGIRLLMKMAWAPSHWHPGLWRMWVWLWNPPAGSDRDLHTHLLSTVPGNSRCSACLFRGVHLFFPGCLSFYFFKAKWILQKLRLWPRIWYPMLWFSGSEYNSLVNTS